MIGRWVRTVPAGLAVIVILLSLGTPAWAHNAFAGSTPKDGAILDQAPATVNLKFLERLVAANVTVTIVDPAGASAVGGAPSFDGPTVLVPLRPTVAGAYTANYAVKSADGHTVSGKITFTLTSAAVPPPAPSPSPSSAAPATTTAGAAEPVLAGDESGTPVWPWVVGGVLLVAGLALLFARRRRGTPAH